MHDFPIHSLDSAPEASRGLLAEIETRWGFLPKLHAALAESPAALRAYEALFSLAEQTGFTPAERQVVFLTVSTFHGCGYCTAAHTFLARQAGLDEGELQALRSGRPLTGRRLESLRRFTLAVVRDRGDPGSQEVEAFLSAGFDEANVLDLLVIIAAKTISNYANHIVGTPMEEFMADPALAWSAA
ncbi:carboxymuconolactone decarboxylase family protein [Nitratireductor thuwali]|uniref:Carboxymuconolactone decarboxylase-like domain-containing protein n=1 Tax=Nitratireductor thuwali TaxID=2267699 RepID=A0ABY5MNL6_9HYPH|nr:hypothetical protein NTH_02900 [Nitratireductor thuwali]